MYVVPSASAPSVVALQVPAHVPLVPSAPSTVVPVPVGSARNVSVEVSLDSAAPAAQPRDLLSHLTRGDREVIAAATGVQLTSSDVVTEARASGVPPWNLIMALARDRKSGALQGEITGAYLSTVFAAHANAPMPFNPSYLNAALLYLRAQVGPAATPAPAPPTTATLGGTVNVYG